MACRTIAAGGKGRRALLTFDDGPDPVVTPQILDLLRQNQARAVFFIVGKRIHRAPELLPRILEEGHVLGNHTWEHAYEDKPVSCWVTELGRCQEEIARLTGFKPDLFRPAQGRIGLSSLLACRRLKLRTVLWDFAGQRIPADLLQRISLPPNLLTELGPYLSPEEIAALCARSEYLRKKGTFPRQPRDRRAMPWPPL